MPFFLLDLRDLNGKVYASQLKFCGRYVTMVLIIFLFTIGGNFMKLDVAQVRAITTGAVRVEEIDNTVHFFRFTKGQEELYKDRSNDFYMKTFASSGICLRFHTDSQTLFSFIPKCPPRVIFCAMPPLRGRA